MASVEASNDGNMATAEDIKYAAEMERLRSELLGVIAPHKESEEEPPFTAAELAVIAAVCWCKGPQTQYDLLGSILKNMRYYRELILDDYVDTRKKDVDERMYDLNEAIPGFLDVFNQYDIPFKPCKGAIGTIVEVFDIRLARAQEMVVLPRAARMFLGRLLRPAQEDIGTFPFLDLPAELRNTIYEMVLTLPVEGIAVCDDYAAGLKTHPRPFVARRPDDSFEPYTTSGDEFLDDDPPVIAMDRLQMNLGLLEVSRQIYEEAMPLFYGLNRFCLTSLRGTVSFLRSTNADRLKHIKSVAINLKLSHYSERDDPLLGDLGPALQRFADVACLEHLNLAIRDGDWIDMSSTRRRLLVGSNPVNIPRRIRISPALISLCLKAKAFRFVYHDLDDGRRIEAYIRKKVELCKEKEERSARKQQQRQSKGGKKGTKRATADEVGESAGRGSGKKVKKA